VERLDWSTAHLLAAGMVVFAFVAIVLTTTLGRVRVQTAP